MFLNLSKEKNERVSMLTNGTEIFLKKMSILRKKKKNRKLQYAHERYRNLSEEKNLKSVNMLVNAIEIFLETSEINWIFMVITKNCFI